MRKVLSRSAGLILVVALVLVGCGGTSSSPNGGDGAAGTQAAGNGGASGSGMAGMGMAGTGAAGTGGKPCVDIACAGACTGDSCDGAWTCDTQVACAQIATSYCGCDGKTFSGSSCAPRAYVFVGTCEAGVSCDPSKVLCKRAQPQCPPGQVPSVAGSCYGPCVPIQYCVCGPDAACPAAPQQPTCDAIKKRCTLSTP